MNIEEISIKLYSLTGNVKWVHKNAWEFSSVFMYPF